MKKLSTYIVTICLIVVLFFLLTNKTKITSDKLQLEKTETAQSNIEDYCYNVDMKWAGSSTFQSFYLVNLNRLDDTKDLSLLLPKKDEVKMLKIDSQNLKKLPTELFEFKNLEQLDISDNPFDDLEQLFDDLTRFPNLKILAMSHCGITTLPDNISNLKTLEGLALDQNINMIEVNENIGELVNLRYLTFRRNKKLKDLPASIGNLKCLEVLIMSGAGFTRIREEVSACKKLKNISANASNIKTIPENIGALEDLRVLNLAYNKIENLPNSIGTLNQLIDLSLSGNDLRELPSSISNLSKLYYISLELNRFKDFPMELLELNGLAYLNVHNNYINEIPLEIVDLPKLKRIYVDHEIISDSNIELLRQRNPNVEVERRDALSLVPHEPKRKN